MAGKQPANGEEQRTNHLERWLRDSRSYLELPLSELSRLARKDNKMVLTFIIDA